MIDPQNPLIVQADPRSPRSESFRTLRTNLQFLDIEGKARTFVVTSSIQSEGKSTTVANLAITLENAGYRVIVIDADLRRPKLATYMGLEGAVGLTDVLIGRAKVGDVMHPWGQRTLYVLPAGKIPPNPSELLGSTQMATLLEVLERDFDVELATLFVRDRDGDGAGHVRVARRREHAACAVDAVSAVGVDGRHDGVWRRPGQMGEWGGGSWV